MNGFKSGGDLKWAEVIGPAAFIEQMPICPAGGKYTFLDRIPNVGELACRCSHEKTKGHVPLL